MGTETALRFVFSIILFHYHVKLNNPQMGTETNFEVLCLSSLNRRQVELNNPLMGTETKIPHIRYRDTQGVKLN